MFTPILATTGAAGETVNFNATTIALTAPSFGIDEAFVFNPATLTLTSPSFSIDEAIVFLSSEILVSGEAFTVESAEEITETFSGGYIHATLSAKKTLLSTKKKKKEILPLHHLMQ